MEIVIGVISIGVAVILYFTCKPSKELLENKVTTKKRKRNDNKRVKRRLK